MAMSERPDRSIDQLTDSLLPRVSSQEWPGGITQYRAACQVAIARYIAELERDKARLINFVHWVADDEGEDDARTAAQELLKEIDAAMAAQEQKG